jgi:hypothetical protein
VKITADVFADLPISAPQPNGKTPNFLPISGAKQHFA